MDTGILSIALLAVWSLIYVITKSIFDTDVYKTNEDGETIYDENGNKVLKYSKNIIQIFIFVIYLVVLFFFQIMASIYGYQDYANSKTGIDNIDISSRIPQIILYTIIPWSVMFCSLVALLKIFPGWKLPFSNTFGYFIVKVLGIKSLMNKLLITYDEIGNNQEVDTDDDNFNRAIRTVKPIIADPSLIVNEISTENFDSFWNTMENGKLLKDEGSFKAIYNKPREDSRSMLERYVSIKENIAELIWYILAGAYIASYVQTITTSIDPPVSNDQLNDQYNDKVDENTENNEDSGKTYYDDE